MLLLMSHFRPKVLVTDLNIIGFQMGLFPLNVLKGIRRLPSAYWSKLFCGLLSTVAYRREVHSHPGGRRAIKMC